MEIKVRHYSDYWECGEGCCSNYDEVSVFEYEDREYKYRSYDTNTNIINFIADVLGIHFLEENY